MNNNLKIVYDKEKKQYVFNGFRMTEHMFNYAELYGSTNDPAYIESIKKELLKPVNFRDHYKVRDVKSVCVKIHKEFLHELSKELVKGKLFRAPVGNYFEIGLSYYSDKELKVTRQKGLLQGFDLFALNYKVPYIQFRGKDAYKRITIKRVGIHKDLYKEFINRVNEGKLETGYVDNKQLIQTIADRYEGLLTYKTVDRIIKKGLNKMGYWASRKRFDLRLTHGDFYFLICGPNYSLLSGRSTKVRQWNYKYRKYKHNVHMYVKINPKRAIQETSDLYGDGLKRETLWVYNGMTPVITPNTYIWRITISREELLDRFECIKGDPYKNTSFCLKDVTLTAKEVAIINTEHLFFLRKEVTKYFQIIKKNKDYVSKR